MNEIRVIEKFLVSGSLVGVTYQGQIVVQVDPHFGGPMIDIILLVSFSGSNPDIWFKHEPEPFDTIRPRRVVRRM